jgi:hypothetical protein
MWSEIRRLVLKSKFRITTLDTRPPHLRSAPPDIVGMICYFHHSCVRGKNKNMLIHAPDNVGLSGLRSCYKVVRSHGLGVACFLVILGLVIESVYWKVACSLLIELSPMDNLDITGLYRSRQQPATNNRHLDQME